MTYQQTTQRNIVCAQYVNVSVNVFSTLKDALKLTLKLTLTQHCGPRLTQTISKPRVLYSLRNKWCCLGNLHQNDFRVWDA